MLNNQTNSIMMNGQHYDQYKVPVIAKLLHSLPHYNITFHQINSTFRPTDEVYLESLGILGSAPAALLIVSLFGLLLYLMTRCCDRKPRPAHSITSLKVTLSIVTVMCCAAIGLGLYGNDDLHNGLEKVLQAGRKIDTIVHTVRNQTNILENTLTNRIRPQLLEFADIFDQEVTNASALSMLIVALSNVQGNITLATNAASDIRRPLMGISMTNFLTRCDQWELIRWPGTVAILALLLVLCAVLLVGVARHSRCALILFSVCGLLAVTGSWLMSGLYLSTSVAVGDLCINPSDFLVSTSPRQLPTNVLLHYIQCEPGHTNPFTLRLRESQNSVASARSAMAIVSKISLGLFKASNLQPKTSAVTADLNSSDRILTQLTALVDCKSVNYHYLLAVRGLCDGGLLGLVLMLIASFIAAILLTIMVWVDSHTWIYIRKRTDYAQVDEPSYISHPAPQNHQTINARTLPRNHNGHFSPPAISGSHTLQHPSKRQQHQQHDMMMGGHGHQHPSQQAMRAMGTHTLGRLPSHNHSPNHLPVGPNNACSDPASIGPPPALQSNRQPIYCHHPHQHPTHTTATAAGHQHPTHLQHAQYHHLQQQQQQQQKLYAANPAHHQQIYQQIPAALNAPTPAAITTTAPSATTALPMATAINQQSIYQSSAMPITSAPVVGIYSSQATMRRQQQQMPQSIYMQQQQQQQQSIYQQQAQAIYQQQHQQQQQQHQQAQSIYQQQQRMPPQPPPKPSPDSIETIPSSNAIDSAMYERDKQIYRCSTLRQGGKFDAKYKPSILNCPLPEIPKEADISANKEQLAKEQILAAPNHYTKTLHRAPMKLPPPGKAIPPPKIDVPIITAAPPPSSAIPNSNFQNVSSQQLQQQQQQQQQQQPKPINNHTKSSPVPTQLASKDIAQQPPQQQQQQQQQQQISVNSQNGNGINPNDDSNYAVTEL